MELQRQQVPSYMLPTTDYRKLMELVVAVNPQSRVFGCAHCPLCGRTAGR